MKNRFLQKEKLLKAGSVFFFCCYFLILTGCGEKDIPSSNVLARVNNYEITRNDYLNEKNKFSHYSSLKETDNQDKILNLLIDQSLLLQEAENKKIHLNRKFLHSMEHFWRQSLIQELLKVKNFEIRNQITITENEIKEFYHLMSKQYKIRSVKCSLNILQPLPAKMNAEEFLTFINNNKTDILEDSSWIWTEIEDLHPSFRNKLIQKQSPQKSLFHIIDQNFLYLFYVMDSKPNKTDSFENLKKNIKAQIQREKEKTIMASWLNDLRQNANMKINHDTLARLSSIDK